MDGFLIGGAGTSSDMWMSFKGSLK